VRAADVLSRLRDGCAVQQQRRLPLARLQRQPLHV